MQARVDGDLPSGDRTRQATHAYGGAGAITHVLLRRNPMALAVRLVMPLGLTAALQVDQPAAARVRVDAADSVIPLAAFALLSVPYDNLVTALVARRQDFGLRRLRAGELSDQEVLAGSALPAAAVAWGQIVIATVAGFAFFGLDAPVNAVLVVAGLILGTVVFGVTPASRTVRVWRGRSCGGSG